MLFYSLLFAQYISGMSYVNLLFSIDNDWFRCFVNFENGAMLRNLTTVIPLIFYYSCIVDMFWDSPPILDTLSPEGGEELVIDQQNFGALYNV